MPVYFWNGATYNTQCEVIVNTVNTKGVMGKGLARAFRSRFPQNYRLYRQHCANKLLGPGYLFITNIDNRIIVNFATKDDWWYSSKKEWISNGLMELRGWIQNSNIQSIAIPYLGCGNGGLDHDWVREEIISILGDLPIRIFICG